MRNIDSACQPAPNVRCILALKHEVITRLRFLETQVTDRGNGASVGVL